MRWMIVIVMVLALSGCTSEKKADRVLAGSGYSNVQYTGYKWFSCSDDDFFHTGFVADGPTGNRVSGTVCSGFFKGNTVRLD